MPTLPATLTYESNAAHRSATNYPAALREIASLEKAAAAFANITSWPDYEPSPLLQLDQLARQIDVATIHYKDESQRFGLKSFKALGGAFAVSRQLQAQIREQSGAEASVEDLLEGRYRDIVQKIVISCATDGNHGRSVAWGCRMFGCGCIIYIHRDVSVGRQQAMEAFGAEVIRITGNYDESVRQAASDAEAHGRIIVSDTSYPGYVDVPRDVALGYTVMLAEAVEQLGDSKPTHVFIQAGVGGLAAAVCAYFWEHWGADRPRFIVVEPEQANCLQESARKGQRVTVDGDLDTLMAGLACGEVSLLAWDILQPGVDDFMTLSEDAVAPCMQLLAHGEPQIEAGESAVAGLAAAIAAREDANFAGKLGLDSNSHIFVIGTEGATDPDVYQRLMAQ